MLKTKLLLTALGLFLLWAGFQTYTFGFVALATVVLVVAKMMGNKKRPYGVTI